MDTNETYIKMCDCEEIQGNRVDSFHEPLEGDWWWHKATDSVSISASSYIYRYSPDFIWLPTQSDLQKMLGDKFPDLKELLYKFSLWAIFYIRQFNSMEQLWLAFYMKELHNKVWSGSEWKKQ